MAIAHPAAAEPGLQGSYMGVAVDIDHADESLQSMLEAGSPTAWLVDEALSQQQNSSGNNSGSNGNTAPTSPAAEITGRQLQGRIDLPNSPLSVRGSIYLGTQNRAVMPTLSYDVPIGGDANVYAGAGYAIVERPGAGATPIGDRNGLVLTAGAEAAISDSIIIYGNVGYRPGTQRMDGNNPMRVQVGVGRRF